MGISNVQRGNATTNFISPVSVDKSRFDSNFKNLCHEKGREYLQATVPRSMNLFPLQPTYLTLILIHMKFLRWSQVDLWVAGSLVRTRHISIDFDSLHGFFFYLAFVYDAFQAPVVQFVCGECNEVDLWVAGSLVRTCHIFIDFDSVHGFSFI